MKVVLGENEFTTLINGGVVKKDGIEIILSDLGYAHMIAIINNELDNR